MKIILGIDPGSRITGYGVIAVNGNHHSYITSGAIRVAEGSVASRLQRIFAAIHDIVVQCNPHEVAIEQVFMHKNPGAAMKLGQARGVAMAAAAMNNLEVHEYSARQVKQSMVGYGAATKDQVQHMVTRLLNLPKLPQADEADALAIAWCHAATGQGLLKLGLGKKIRRGRLR